MLHGFFAELVDEMAANVLLHRFFRYRGTPDARGPLPEEDRGLYSGELSTFYAPRPAAADLERNRQVVEERPSQTVCDLRFASVSPSGWRENDQVWCRHWTGTVPSAGLTVVGVDGIVQLGSGWFWRLADGLNPSGIDVMMLDAPFNYRRTPGGFRPGQLIIGGDLGHQLAVTRQAVLDLWALVQSVQDTGRRVGLVGVSYGGWLALLAALVMDEIDFVVAVVPPVNIARMLRRGGTLVRAIRRGLGFVPLNEPALERAARPVIPSLWTPRLPGSRIVLHAARYDRFVPPQGIEELAETWKTKLVVHAEAHYRLAVSAAATPLVVREVLDLWSTSHARPAAGKRARG